MKAEERETLSLGLAHGQSLRTMARVVGRFDGAASLSFEGAGKYSRGSSSNLFVKYHESARSMCVEADPRSPSRGE